jgi:hypothetical protein
MGAMQRKAFIHRLTALAEKPVQLGSERKLSKHVFDSLFANQVGHGYLTSSESGSIF